MEIKQIIEKLCNHEISKKDAIEQLLIITDGFRKNNALEFTVEEIAYSIVNNDAILKLKLPYRYSEIEGRIRKGDKVDVIFLP